MDIRFYRYVCPNCLRTFLDGELQINATCWKCKHSLVIFEGNPFWCPEDDPLKNNPTSLR